MSSSGIHISGFSFRTLSGILTKKIFRKIEFLVNSLSFFKDSLSFPQRFLEFVSEFLEFSTFPLIFVLCDTSYLNRKGTKPLNDINKHADLLLLVPKLFRNIEFLEFSLSFCLEFWNPWVFFRLSFFSKCETKSLF